MRMTFPDLLAGLQNQSWSAERHVHVDDQAKAPAFEKKCKPIAARVVVDAVLANACNRILSNEVQNLLRLQP